MSIDTQKLRNLVTFDFEMPVSVMDAVGAACDHIDAQAAEIARLREALRPLAGIDLTEPPPIDFAWFVLRARAALAQEQGGSDDA